MGAMAVLGRLVVGAAEDAVEHATDAGDGGAGVFAGGAAFDDRLDEVGLLEVGLLGFSFVDQPLTQQAGKDSALASSTPLRAPGGLS